MLKKLGYILIPVMLALLIFVVPVSAKNDNIGTPFQELWDMINGLDEQVRELWNTISGLDEQVQGLASAVSDFEGEFEVLTSEVSSAGSQAAGSSALIIQAHKESVQPTTSAGWVKIYEYKAGMNMTLDEVQIYCSAASPQARVDIRRNGTSLISAQQLAGGTVILSPVVISSLEKGQVISVYTYTDIPGCYISDLGVTMTVNINGD